MFSLAQFFCSLPHSLVLINNLSQQILSLHILHFITAHFTFITAQIGYHCTLKLGMDCILSWGRARKMNPMAVAMGVLRGVVNPQLF
jgi:hypothetical protein